MQEKTMQKIVDVAEQHGIDISEHGRYEGRYGVKSFAVTGRLSDFIHAVAVTVQDLADKNASECNELVDDLDNIRMDNLGTSYIFY